MLATILPVAAYWGTRLFAAYLGATSVAVVAGVVVFAAMVAVAAYVVAFVLGLCRAAARQPEPEPPVELPHSYTVIQRFADELRHAIDAVKDPADG